MTSKPILTYKSYCDDCDRFGVTNPYPDEASFNRAYGIIEQVEPPLIITPKKPVIKQSLTTEKSDHIRDVTKKVQQPKKPKAVKPPPKQSNKQHIYKRTSLAGMTPEEIKKHRAKLAKNRL